MNSSCVIRNIHCINNKTDVREKNGYEWGRKLYFR